MGTKLEKAIRELEDGYILGVKLSPHEKDIFREGFLYALKPEHMKLTPEVKGLVEAAKDAAHQGVDFGYGPYESDYETKCREALKPFEKEN